MDTNQSTPQFCFLWFEEINDGQDQLPDRVYRATDRYKARFGHWPKVCLLNPQEAVDAQSVAQIDFPVEISVDPRVPEGYFFLESDR